MIFNRPYKTIGVEAGDERTVTGISRTWGNVRLEDDKGNGVLWQPGRLAAAKGGVEVYRGEAMELRAGDRVRWTRNDPGSGLVNGETAVVDSIERDGVRFRFDDGSVTKLADGDPQLRHIDRAWAATVGPLKNSVFWRRDLCRVRWEQRHGGQLDAIRLEERAAGSCRANLTVQKAQRMAGRAAASRLRLIAAAVR